MNTNDVWFQYGLRANPFFQEPLSGIDDQHPLDLMVGRSHDLALARRVLQMAGESGRLIVEGGPGVGKTTFVNRLKQKLNEEFITHELPIRVEAETTPQQFHVEVLREILKMRTQVLGEDANLAKGAKDESSTAFWAELTAKIEGRLTRSYGGNIGASIAGFGGNLGGQKQDKRDAPDLSGSLHREMAEAIARARKELGRRLLFHINNFENLTLKGYENASDLILQIRDDLMIAGAHWLFVGPSDLTAKVFRTRRQVSGIIAQPIHLEPLTAEQVGDLLERRYAHLSNGFKRTEPVRVSDAAMLYKSYLGDLRNFLRLLSDAAGRLLGVAGVTPMSIAQICGTVRADYRKELEMSLSQAALEHWFKILSAGKSGGPFTVTRFRATDAARYTGKTAPTVNNTIDALKAAQCISIGERDGRSQWYDVTGPALIAYDIATSGVDS